MKEIYIKIIKIIEQNGKDKPFRLRETSRRLNFNHPELLASKIKRLEKLGVIQKTKKSKNDVFYEVVNRDQLFSEEVNEVIYKLQERIFKLETTQNNLINIIVKKIEQKIKKFLSKFLKGI